MTRSLAFSLALSLLLIVGCTPTGEGVVKRFEKPSEFLDVKAPSTASAGIEETPPAPLDPATQQIIQSYGPTIRLYSQRYGLDWRLILAVIKQESRFAPGAESRQGAIGLMQIMPVTEVEVSRILEVKDLSHPRNNIHGGIFYLKRLYGLFGRADESDRIRLALAAYNAGLGRIRDAQDVSSYVHDDPLKWESVRDALPLLSRRYLTLHRNVWRLDRPKSGWFGNSRQTIQYVESVMNYYDDYRLYLN